MAAIMSTINAQLLQSSATIIKDLYLNLRPEQLKNETRLKRMSAMIMCWARYCCWPPGNHER
jgi:sodium/pantothenate symporter